MEKPVTIRRKEMIEKICSAINESGLPAFAIRDALRLIDQDLVRAQEEELKRDTQAWTVYQVNEAKKKTEWQEVDNGLE